VPLLLLGNPFFNKFFEKLCSQIISTVIVFCEHYLDNSQVISYITRSFLKMDIFKMSKNEKSFGELPKKTKSPWGVPNSLFLQSLRKSFKSIT